MKRMRLDKQCWRLEVGFVCTLRYFEHLCAVETLNSYDPCMVCDGKCFVCKLNCRWLYGKDALVHYNCPGAKSQRCIETVQLQAT